ncbi:MarR family winged helix-turn-helix transcriptional regulator [Mycoplasma sp. P36-A1]|uniref:MarR family winged helix-turn-helix transcriptional regulator n=1 Tax=Mycoplasma sp. P36-A1 TaxID=3252900 RepID=UPI003C2CC6F2
MKNREEVMNHLFVELFNHLLYIEEINIQKSGIDLTMTEVHTIEAVANVDIPSMSNIAKSLMITIGTATTAIKKLEKKGYVERIREQSDARVVLVKLTPKAYDVLAIHDEFHRNMIEHILDNLGTQEEEILLEALTKIKTFFNKEK